MTKKVIEISGSIVAPQGFKASGVFCDIKRIGTGKGSDKGQKRDLGLIVSNVPATVAGLFTTNQICAAPVKACLERVKKGRAQAIVVNSGNANACTGKQGMKDALEMVSFTERALNPTIMIEVSPGRSRGLFGNMVAKKPKQQQTSFAANDHGGCFSAASPLDIDYPLSTKSSTSSPKGRLIRFMFVEKFFTLMARKTSTLPQRTLF